MIRFLLQQEDRIYLSNYIRYNYSHNKRDYVFTFFQKTENVAPSTETSCDENRREKKKKHVDDTMRNDSLER